MLTKTLIKIQITNKKQQKSTYHLSKLQVMVKNSYFTAPIPITPKLLPKTLIKSQITNTKSKITDTKATTLFLTVVSDLVAC